MQIQFLTLDYPTVGGNSPVDYSILQCSDHYYIIEKYIVSYDVSNCSKKII